MKKRTLLFGVIAIVAAVLLITPYFFGQKAQENMENLISQVNNAPGYEMTLVEYDRGWFTSRSIVKYGFDQKTLDVLEEAEKADPTDEVFMELLKKGATFKITQAHGPVTLQNGINFALLTAEGQLELADSDFLNEIYASNKIDSLVDMQAQVSYAGELEANFTSPKVIYDDPLTPNKNDIKFGGMNVSLKMNSASENLQIQGTIPQFILDTNIEDSLISLQMSNISFENEGTKLTENIWTGKGNLTFGKYILEFPGPNGRAVMENLNISYDLAEQDPETLSAAFVIAMDKFNIPNFGSLSDLKTDVLFTNLDIQATSDYIKDVQAASSQMPSVGSPAEAQKMQTDIMAQAIAKSAGRFLARSPRMDINVIQFGLNDGFVKGTGFAKIDGEGLTNIEQLEDQAELQKRLAVDTTIHFDQKLAENLMSMTVKDQMAKGGVDVSQLTPEEIQQAVTMQTSLFLTTFRSQGWVEKIASQQYKAQLQYGEDGMILNGKPFALPQQ